MARRVSKFSAKAGSIPVTQEMRQDIDAMVEAGACGGTIDGIVRKGLTMVINRWKRVKVVEKP